MEPAAYNEAKKRFATYEMRVAEPSLTVDGAYEIIVADSVRAERDALLTATDFRMIRDTPWEKSSWAAYRQALRDIPDSPGFPYDVIWPEEPS